MQVLLYSLKQMKLELSDSLTEKKLQICTFYATILRMLYGPL